MKKKISLTLFILSLVLSACGLAQITLIDSFNPANPGSICALGFDTDSSRVWVYGCSDNLIYSFTTAGVFLTSFPNPGEAANDVDIDVVTTDMVLGTTAVPKGSLLFINGETDVAEVYALNPQNGNIIATLTTAFGTGYVVGGAYHRQRNTIFLVQSAIPSFEENRVAEINVQTGDTIQTFLIGTSFGINYGDIAISGAGNLYLVTSEQTGIAEFTPDGLLVQIHAVPSTATTKSGLGLDCDNDEAWAAATDGTVYHLGQFPCEPFNAVENIAQPLFIQSFAPNPFSETGHVTIQLPQPSHLRLSLFDLLGQEQRVLFDGDFTSKTFDYNLDGQDLAHGVYLLKAESNGLIATKAIVHAN